MVIKSLSLANVQGTVIYTTRETHDATNALARDAPKRLRCLQALFLRCKTVIFTIICLFNLSIDHIMLPTYLYVRNQSSITCCQD